MEPTLRNVNLVSMAPNVARLLTTALDRAMDLYDRARDLRSPALGSPAELDAAIDHARWIVMGSGMSLTVATDHLVAWRTLLRSGQPLTTFAPITLVRAAATPGPS